MRWWMAWMGMFLVGGAFLLMLNGAQGAPNLFLTKHTPYCRSCDLCIMADDKEDLTEADISFVAENYLEKTTYYNLDIGQTFEKVDVCGYDNDGKLECEKFYEMCWHWDRDRQDVVDLIPVVLGVEQRQWATWSPTTAVWINPLTSTYIANTIWINATVVDSNLNLVQWRMEWENGTTAFDWIDMVGHDEIISGTERTGVVTGTFYDNGREVYTASKGYLVDYLYGITDADALDDLWDCGAWQWNIANAMGGASCNCYKPTEENCTGAEIFQARDSKCVFDIRSTAANDLNLHNYSFDNVTWYNSTGWTSANVWYEITSDVISGVDNGDGWYNYTFYFATLYPRANAYSWWSGLRCNPQTSIWSNRTSFYGELDTTAHAEGAYVLRLNITNSTAGFDNTTITSNITIDNAAPTCIIEYPPDFAGFGGCDDCIGYVTNYPVSNVTASDSGSGIDEVNITWVGTTANYGNFSMSDDGTNYWNDSYIGNDDFDVCAFCFDLAGKLGSNCTTATVKWYGIDSEQNATLYGITTTATTQDVDIIIGFFLFAGLCFVVAYIFQRSSGVTSFFGMFMFLFFAGMGIFVMSLGASAIYTGWNNTDTWNSSGMGIPNTMMNLSFWGIWVWVTLVILGVLFWLMKWFGEYRGVKMK